MSEWLIRPQDVFVIGRVQILLGEREYHFYGYRRPGEDNEVDNLRLLKKISATIYSGYELEYLGVRKEGLDDLEDHLARNLSTNELRKEEMYYRVEFLKGKEVTFQPVVEVWPISTWYFAWPTAYHINNQETARDDVWFDWGNSKSFQITKDLDIPF